MTNVLALLESKLKKHNWFWSTSTDPDEQVMGKANFNDIQRLMVEAKNQGKQAEALTLFTKYQKIR